MAYGNGWETEARAAMVAVPPRSAWIRALPYDTGICTMTSGTSARRARPRAVIMMTQSRCKSLATSCPPPRRLANASPALLFALQVVRPRLCGTRAWQGGRPKVIACPTVSLAVSVRARSSYLPYAGQQAMDAYLPAGTSACNDEAERAGASLLSPSAARPTDEPQVRSAWQPIGGRCDAPEGELEASNVMFAWEAIRPLCYGHAVLVVPDDKIVDTVQLPSYFAQHGATRILSTPSLLGTLLDTAAEADYAAARLPPVSSPKGEIRPGRAEDCGGGPGSGVPGELKALSAALATMRLWLLCGEVVPTPLADRVAAAVPHLTLANDYSSWEGSDIAIATDLVKSTPRSSRSAPVGSLLAGVRCAVLSQATGEAVPIGTIGELWVASAMCFTEYVGAPLLSVERLCAMPQAMRRLPSRSARRAARPPHETLRLCPPASHHDPLAVRIACRWTKFGSVTPSSTRSRLTEPPPRPHR